MVPRETAVAPVSTSGDTPEPSEGPTSTRPARHGNIRRAAPYLVFPVLAIAMFLGLVATAIHGSSIGAYDEASADHSLLAGTPRDIRSDEYLIQTPNSIGNVRRGLDTDFWFGLVRVDPAAVGIIPSRDWSESLRPQDWGFFVDAAHGLAWHWWFGFLAGLLGLYALLLQLVRSAPQAAVLAVVGAFSPYSGWWSGAPALELGYAAGAAAAGVAALRARRPAIAAPLAVVSGLLAAALALTLYPPWIVSLLLVAVAVVVGQVIDIRPRLGRLLWLAAVAAGSAGLPLLAWFVQHREAISAIANTYYPGGRRSEAGQAWLPHLLDAPLNPWLSGDPGATLTPEPGSTGSTASLNLSEASSSWFPLGVLVAILVVVASSVSTRRRGTPGGAPAATDETPPAPWATFWCTVGVTALIVSWALLPLPSVVGRLTLLDRVPSYRTPIAICFCSVLLVALGGELLRRRSLGWPQVLLLAAGAAVSGAAAIWSAEWLHWDEHLVSLPVALGSGLVLGAGFAVIASGRFRLAAGALLAGYCAVSWALINPIYHGLGPLQNDVVVKSMEAVENKHPGTVVAVYDGEDYRLGALVAASGAQSLSGMTSYPDPAVMRRLVPGDQERLWNNYVSYRWVADPTQRPATIHQVRGTRMDLRINPCAPETLALGMTWTLSRQPIHAPCLNRVDVLNSRAVGKVYRYRVER